MSYLDLTNDRPGANDNVAETSEQRFQDDLVALLPNKAYTNMNSATRSLLLEMLERFLNDAQFRKMMGAFLFYSPAPTYPIVHLRVPSNQFPFMKLPANIRVMIAKYALSYKEGLVWFWKTDRYGRKVGSFVAKEIRSDSFLAYLEEPMTRLCLSRQLRQETSRLWITSNTLHFGGDLDIYAGSSILTEEDLALGNEQIVDAYAFFNFHANCIYLSVFAQVSINTYAFGLSPAAVQKLAQVMRGRIDPKVRVVDGACFISDPTTDCVELFRSRMYQMARILRYSDRPRFQRSWRVFPDSSVRKCKDRLKQYLSPQDYRLALRFIEEGL